MLDKYLHWLEHNQGRAVSTVNVYHAYLTRLKLHLADHGKTLATADRRLLEEFIGPIAHKAGITPSSRRPLIAAVRSLYHWAEASHLIAASPAKHLSYPKIGKPLPTPISRRNAEKMLNRCDLNTFVGQRDAAIIAMLISSGMRVSGIASLTQQSLIYDEVYPGQAPVLFVRVTEKGSKTRIIPLPDLMSLYLLQYTNSDEFVRLMPVLRLQNGDHALWVQTQRSQLPEHEWYGEKRRLSSGGIRDMLKRRGKECGIPAKECHPHAFRHLYGTELAEADVDPQRIQLLMGHASAETSNVYKHLAVRKLFEVANNHTPLAGMETPMHAIMQKLKKRKSLPTL